MPRIQIEEAPGEGPVEGVAEFLVEAPLYTRVTIRARDIDSPYISNIIPKHVDRRCEKCGQTTRWDRTFPQHQPGAIVQALGVVVLKCRNCGEAEFRVWFCFEHLKAQKQLALGKVGQCPKSDIDPPKELAQAFKRPQLELYKAGKILRHHGYGIGALTYFRRLVEDTTNDMLDLLVAAMKETGADETDIDRVTEAKTNRIFEDKVKLAGDVLPKHLRPGGINPFHVVYDQVSGGIHRLTDAECCAIVDKLDAALTFIYKELKTHVEQQKSFIQAMKGLSK